ncbi:MAG: hypothetical protein KBB55_00625 [Candidatus Buchananbacteria bacterium]|nr:hypothetical protein [Candidatus Buchananbacteria bacterium]
MEKTSVLYHGSPNGEIEEFLPRVSKGSGESHGALVYASPDKATAIMFMANVSVPWSTGLTGNNVLYAIIPMDRDIFIANDHGGYVYMLDAKTFSSDPQRGMGEYEWASSVPVKPLEKIRFESVLEAMIEHGVQVYFVEQEKYQTMLESKQPKYTFLKDLESENARRLRGVIESK